MLSITIYQSYNLIRIIILMTNPTVSDCISLLYIIKSIRHAELKAQKHFGVFHS